MVVTSFCLLQRFASKPCRAVPFHTNKFFYAERTNPDKFWGKRKWLFLAQDMQRRFRYVKKSARIHSLKLMAREHDLWSKRIMDRDIEALNLVRLEAACKEVDFEGWHLREGLVRSHVHVDEGVLADLAIWEPRTFRSLVAVAADRAMKDPAEGGMGHGPCGPGTTVNIGPT